MTIDPRAWAAFGRAHAATLLPNRIQSMVTAKDLGLVPLPLLPLTKHVAKSSTSLADWESPDSAANWGLPLLGDWLDIDADVRPCINPKDPKSYTPAFYTAARVVMATILQPFNNLGLRFLSYGRESMGYQGHIIIEVSQTKADAEAIQALQMVRPVEVETLGVTVRIEVRRPAKTKKEGESRKTWTLPGSVYQRQDEKGLDLIGWTGLYPGLTSGMSLFQPQKEPLAKVRLALYTGMMALAVQPHYAEGVRNDLCLCLSGALVKAAQAEMFSIEDARSILAYIVTEEGDPEAQSRLDSFDRTVARAERGEPIKSYKDLGEYVDKEWMKALRNFVGGGDPDAVATLAERICRINERQCWIDLSGGPEHCEEMTKGAVQARYDPSDEFQPIFNKKGQATSPIYVVVRSPKLRTYTGMKRFPGEPFGALFFKDPEANNAFVRITDARGPQKGDHVYINVSASIATPPLPEGEMPDENVYAEALGLWRRYAAHLTSNTPGGEGKLDQLIAWKVQHPRKKLQAGCALAGGMRTGKSFLFTHIMPTLVGRTLVELANSDSLFGNFYLERIDNCLFYCVDEFKFHELDKWPDSRNRIKNLMRSQWVKINEKFVKKGPAVETVALPFFLSNEDHPQFVIDGVPDRCLVVLRGDSQASLGMTQTEWEDHQHLIDEEAKEFLEALNRPEIRSALMHHFYTLELSEDIFFQNESADLGVDVLMAGLTLTQQALLGILEDGYFYANTRGGQRGPSITDPVAVQTLVKAVGSRVKSRDNTSPRPDMRAIMEAFRTLFQEKNKGLDDPSNFFQVTWHRPSGGKPERLYYFRDRRGELLKKLRERRGIELSPSYQLDKDGELGPAVEPTREARAASHTFEARDNSNVLDGPWGGKSYGI